MAGEGKVNTAKHLCKLKYNSALAFFHCSPRKKIKDIVQN